MSDFIQEIYTWFRRNKRDLPWRDTNDPYKIWLSEIILQQTRVVQGIDYYTRFVQVFPTLNDLANAPEDKVLKLWQGLGYYSRARNLHFTAKYIAENFKGKFPTDYNIILSLKGIGSYTAAAISSIAFNKSYPVVDGNVYRLLSRYFGIETPIDSSSGKKEFQHTAEQLMPDRNAGFHNQALMEFGALQCIPKSPDCSSCPLQTSCFAYKNNSIGQLPVKEKKQKKRNRYFYYFYFQHKTQILLEKRTGDDIWKNLYQFPLHETSKELSETEVLSLQHPEFAKSECTVVLVSPVKKHILSHQVIYARLIIVELKTAEYIKGQFFSIIRKDIFKFAVPRLIEEFIEDYNLGDKLL